MHGAHIYLRLSNNRNKEKITFIKYDLNFLTAPSLPMPVGCPWVFPVPSFRIPTPPLQTYSVSWQVCW